MNTRYISWLMDSKNLISVTKHFCTSSVAAHKHEFVELVFIVAGTCKHYYNDCEVALVPGDVFVIHPLEEHSYCIDDEVVIYNCLFFPQVLSNELTALKKVCGIFDFLMVEPYFRNSGGKQEILRLNDKELQDITIILENMISELNCRNSGYELVTRSCLINLLVMLGRIHESQFLVKTPENIVNREVLSAAISYIEQNLTNEMRIEDIAAIVYLSPHYFRKIFKKSIGVAPNEYINKLRINKAEELLIERKYTISQIAEMVGIYDANYFSRLFKKFTGQSPSEYSMR